jgi:cleavage and polyadenylation specificity factor subunit 3
MNRNINNESSNNAFNFKYIKNLKHINDIDESRPVVVMAAPGMLQSGLSRQVNRFTPALKYCL